MALESQWAPAVSDPMGLRYSSTFLVGNWRQAATAEGGRTPGL